jgi:hypothetical protein
MVSLAFCYLPDKDNFFPAEDIYITDIIEQESSFKLDGKIYKLETVGELIHNDKWIDNNLKIDYEVSVDGKVLNNNHYNTIEVDCDFMHGGPFENHYEIDIIDDTKNPGWIIYSGGVCSMTSFQYNAEFIFPDTDSCIDYYSTNETFKNKPLTKRDKDNINIYYTTHVWNNAGTACSILVPRKTIFNNKKKSSYNRPILVSDLDIIGDYGFRSLFMSGYKDYNIELMQYALDEFYVNDSENCYEWFFGVDILTNRPAILGEDYNYWSLSGELRTEEVDYGTFNLSLYSSSKDRFQKVIDNLWDIRNIVKSIDKNIKF